MLRTAEEGKVRPPPRYSFLINGAAGLKT
jgi:hypothetical protein